MRYFRIIPLLAAVLLSTAAWGVTINPTLDINYRPKADKSGWNANPKSAKDAGNTNFENKWYSQLFSIQRYEIQNFATAKTVTLTLHNSTGQTYDLAVWAFPYDIPLDKDYDATKRRTFFDNVEKVTGRLLSDNTSADFYNMIGAASKNSDNNWVIKIDASSITPYQYNGTTAIVQLLISTNKPSLNGAGHYNSNNSANGENRPKIDVTYYEEDHKYPKTEFCYRFSGEAWHINWNGGGAPRLPEDHTNFETNYSGSIFTVEQFVIDNYSPAKTYTLTLHKNNRNQTITVWDFPHELLMTDKTTCKSLLANIESVTGWSHNSTSTAPSKAGIDSQSCSDNKWTFTIPGYKLTPVVYVGSTAVVNLLFTGPDGSTYYSTNTDNEEANRPTLLYATDSDVKIANVTKHITYAADALSSAVSAANDSDVIVLADDASLSARLEITKNLTIRGATGTEKVTYSTDKSTIVFLANGDTKEYTVNFRNFVVDGENKDARSIQTFDVNKKAIVRFDGVSVVNTTYDVGKADVKMAGKELILTGNNSFETGIVLNLYKSLTHEYASHSSAMPLILSHDYTDYDIVANCTDASKYTVADEFNKATWNLAVNGNNLRVSRSAVTLIDSDENNQKIVNALHEKTLDVTLERTIVRSGTEYSTFCAPFAISRTDLENQLGTTEVLRLKRVDAGATEDVYVFDDDVEDLEAGVPYLIKPAADDDNVTSLSFSGVTIDKTMHPVVLGSYQFIPLFSQETIADATQAANKSVVYLGAGNQLYYAAANASVKGFRAYFQIPETPASAPARRMRIGYAHQTPTGIENQTVNGKCQNGKLIRNGQVIIVRDGIEYNLMGQMVK